MFSRINPGMTLLVLIFTCIWNPMAFAQTPKLENAQGMARHWSNLAGFTAKCVESQLIEAENNKYARFGAYLGGFLLGAMIRDPQAAQKTLTPYLNEGANGRVHEFNTEGKFMAYDIEFSKENCTTLSAGLKSHFDLFSSSVLEGS